MTRECNIVGCKRSAPHRLIAEKIGFFGNVPLARWWFCEDHINAIKDNIFKIISGEIQLK